MKPRKLRAEIARLERQIPTLEQRSKTAAAKADGARTAYRAAKTAYKAAKKAHRTARKAAGELTGQLRTATRRLQRLQHKAKAETRDKEAKVARPKPAPKGKTSPARRK